MLAINPTVAWSHPESHYLDFIMKSQPSPPPAAFADAASPPTGFWLGVLPGVMSDHGHTMSKPVSSKWKYAALTLGLLFALSLAGHYQMKESIRDTFYYDHQVTVVDAESGAPLEPSVGMPGSSSSDHYPQRAGIGASGDGKFEIEGVAYSDRKWKFSLDGYRPEVLVIGPGSDHSREIVIRMTKASSP